MSRPTVFVHVGCRKTGTSFLQKAIYSSTDALAAQGIALPLPGRGEHYQVVAALREVVDGHPVPPDSRQVIDDLARTVGVIALDRAIMTHEALAPATPAQVRTLMDALDGCEVHVVITARDLARQVPSEWQQTVKDRSVLPYAVFCREVVEGGSPPRTSSGRARTLPTSPGAGPPTCHPNGCTSWPCRPRVRRRSSCSACSPV